MYDKKIRKKRMITFAMYIYIYIYIFYITTEIQNDKN